MIEDVISSITEAEAKAEDIQREAFEQAKVIVLQAEKESTRMRADTVSEYREEKKKKLAEAKAVADSAAEKVVEAGKEKVEAFGKEAEKAISSAAEFIAKELTNKYVDD